MSRGYVISAKTTGVRYGKLLTNKRMALITSYKARHKWMRKRHQWSGEEAIQFHRWEDGFEGMLYGHTTAHSKGP